MFSRDTVSIHPDSEFFYHHYVNTHTKNKGHLTDLAPVGSNSGSPNIAIDVYKHRPVLLTLFFNIQSGNIMKLSALILIRDAEFDNYKYL